MKKNHSLGRICAALKKYDRYLLSCHVAPEGDAIGSLLALDSLLRRLGKNTTVVCEDPFPERLTCLSSKKWNLPKDLTKATLFESAIVVDCPNLDRIGSVKQFIGPETVVFNFDHHISNDFFGDYNFVRPQASATGEVVMMLFHALKISISKEEARDLYVAISTDTGSFKYGNTTAQTHRRASELINIGIPLEKLNEELYSTYSLKKINLFGRLLSRVQIDAKGAIAWSWIKRRDLEELKASDEDTEGFVDFLRYLKEVKIAFTLMEQKEVPFVKVSFRSKGECDVNKIATAFGGGGHRKASGCAFRATIEEAQKVILKRIHEEMAIE
ncbi:MAG: bifunctional oligoribonuclease/PAP phosphatase NrnA [Candidatus Omnitrophica bacterium]|nr:bifunctional oligoribonuclease/PAP phosphatase NrnA [Candidatus Omnitrophota bacterium]